MRLATPPAALAPMFDTLITVRAPKGREELAEPWKVMAWLHETDPYSTGAAAGDGQQATTWQVGILVESLHGRDVVPGSAIYPVPERHTPRLYVRSVQHNGAVVHLTCTAQRRET